MRVPPDSVSERHAVGAGSDIHWLEAGEGDLLVLIHGSLCDHRYWRWQVPQFAEHFHVLAPSLPGCWPCAVGSELAESGSDAVRRAAMSDPRYSIEQHVKFIEELCHQTAGKSRVHLLGHSRGAQVALEAALALADQTASLVLADPGFSFVGEPLAAAVHNTVAGKLGAAPLDEVIGEFVDAVNGPDTWRRTVPWFKEMVRANAWTLLPQLKDIDRAVDARELSRKLNCPVLLVGGEHSPPRYGNRIEALMQVLPHAQQIIVPRAAHGMNLANARFFNDAVLNFLPKPGQT